MAIRRRGPGIQKRRRNLGVELGLMGLETACECFELVTMVVVIGMSFGEKEKEASYLAELLFSMTLGTSCQRSGIVTAGEKWMLIKGMHTRRSFVMR